jgi:hypothetical protein
MRDIVKEIIALELHDAPAACIKLDVEKAVLSIEVDFYNEEQRSYFKKILAFTGVKGIKLDCPEDASDFEITNVDVEKREVGFFIGFLFLTGFGKPSVSLGFLFQDVEIIGNSDPLH